MMTQTNLKMKKIVLAILTISLLISCNNLQTKSVNKNDRFELVPESDKELREKYEQQELNKSKCIFSNPDTSVVGIKIGNAKSILNILGKETKLQGDSTHIFYSNDKKQKLGLTVHAGSTYNQVSIFKISYSEDTKQNFQQINSKELKTEKGIKLGISKRKIIEKLGTCYEAKDSTKTSIELIYRLEFPNDSKTKLLKNNNMPIYYATYRLTNDKLENIEFGFEYP